MNRLLYCDVVEGPLFVLTFLVNGAFVDGYSFVRHPVSSLQLAGWVFAGWPLACFVLARHFRRWYSIASGVAIPTFVLTNAAFAQTPGLVEIGGLLQRLTIVIGFTWLAVFGAAMLVNRRDLG